MYRDRTDAGEKLARVVDAHDVAADIVLAIPRGGVPVGRIVADLLGTPLDIIVARKLGAPGNPELAIGAVAADGSVWRNEMLIDSLGVTEGYLEETIAKERENAHEKAERYRGKRETPDLNDKRVVIVDDGIATGATALACVRLAKAAGASRVILAVPVSSESGAERLMSEADEVICEMTPAYFTAVGQFYETFEQVTDEAAMSALDGYFE
ncbi:MULTISPECIES: phosphoribosyltransferase [unclassified Haladaptatus]|uniref:phosphoribosyltransferase n=1 Tax=unclassified Haladaptatus TaxID=2622732 RepID=UPI0023E8B46E|nr:MULTISPECIES: phosphoribosyltransferase family protein [unclassified Haladaptatus]